MSFDGSGSTRGGADGLHNEDAYLVRESLGLYVVCDGAGDRKAGEIASRMAVEALEAAVQDAEREVDLRRARIARWVVDRAMRRMLDALEDRSWNDPEVGGFDTTVTMLLAQHRTGVIGHRGDSRAYLFRGTALHQLTVDHELTTEVTNGGGRPGYEVFTFDLRPDDTIVLCSDGAEQAVELPEIRRVALDLSPRVLASRIVRAAHRLTPDSDATAVVVRVRGGRGVHELELSRPPQGTAFGHALELV